MLQKRVVVVSAAVAVLGLAAAVLGFAAEATKSKAFVGFDGQSCVYRRTPALVCGIAAALLVLTGLAVVTAASGCFGRYGGHASAPGGRRRSATFKLSTVAWVLVVAATVMFLYGAWRNAGGTSGLSKGRSGRRHGRVYYTGCTVLKGGVFATASIASAVATACAIAAYVNLQRGDEPAPGQFAGPPGIAMGHPQWAQPPPPAYPPVAYPAPPPYGYGGYGAKQPGTA